MRASARLARPRPPVYWLFDTFSYKSYLLLPRNLRQFWPRRDQPTPAGVGGLMALLAQQRYGANWRPETGVVSHSGHKRLLPTAAPSGRGGAFRPRCQFFRPGQPRPPRRRPPGLPGSLVGTQSDRGARPDVEVLIAGAASDPAPRPVGATKRALVVTFSATKLRPTCIIQRPRVLFVGCQYFVWR